MSNIKPFSFETAGPMVEQQTGQERFEVALARFVGNVNEFRRFHYETHYANIASSRDVVEIDPRGVKFVRIVLTSPISGGRQVYCFVEKATGNVLKADGWKSPAKGIRGNIYSNDWAGYGCTEYGAAYAR